MTKSKFTGSPEHKRETANLSALWERAKESGQLGDANTTRKFAEKFGFKSHSAVSNCLKGHMSMSLELARKFATGLGVNLIDVCPRWAAMVSDAQDLPVDNEVIHQVLEVLTALPHEKQRLVLDVASAMLPTNQ